MGWLVSYANGSIDSVHMRDNFNPALDSMFAFFLTENWWVEFWTKTN